MKLPATRKSEGASELSGGKASSITISLYTKARQLSCKSTKHVLLTFRRGEQSYRTPFRSRDSTTNWNSSPKIPRLLNIEICNGRSTTGDLYYAMVIRARFMMRHVYLQTFPRCNHNDRCAIAEIPFAVSKEIRSSKRQYLFLEEYVLIESKHRMARSSSRKISDNAGRMQCFCSYSSVNATPSASHLKILFTDSIKRNLLTRLSQTFSDTQRLPQRVFAFQ